MDICSHEKHVETSNLFNVNVHNCSLTSVTYFMDDPHILQILNTVERRLSGLIGTRPRPDRRITRIMSQMIYLITNSSFFVEVYLVF